MKFQSAYFEKYLWEGVESYYSLIHEAKELGLLVIGDPKTSLAVATALFGVFLMLWFVFPLAMRLFHPQD